MVVGVAIHGRSFKMAQAGGDLGELPVHGVTSRVQRRQGRCTDTAGYISNAEIGEIIRTGNVNRQWIKEGSNMMVYNNTRSGWPTWTTTRKGPGRPFTIRTTLPAPRTGLSTCRHILSESDAAPSVPVFRLTDYEDYRVGPLVRPNPFRANFEI